MRQKLIRVVLLLLIAGGVGAVAVYTPAGRSIRRSVFTLTPDDIMQSVCHIGASGDYGSWEASGVYVGNGLILTAGHVVDGADTFVVTFENEPSSYASSTFYQESTVDIGFIYLEDYDGPVLCFEDGGFNRGDSVWIYGNTFGWLNHFSVTEGIISNICRDCDGFFGEKLLFQVDAASWPGNSGGPVVDDEGEIIGILVGGYGFSECLSYCVPATICERAMITYLSILEMSRLQ